MTLGNAAAARVRLRFRAWIVRRTQEDDRSRAFRSEGLARSDTNCNGSESWIAISRLALSCTFCI